jgi:hypothetical protein
VRRYASFFKNVDKIALFFREDCSASGIMIRAIVP